MSQVNKLYLRVEKLADNIKTLSAKQFSSEVLVINVNMLFVDFLDDIKNLGFALVLEGNPITKLEFKINGARRKITPTVAWKKFTETPIEYTKFLGMLV